jgi:hypothetical protein
MFSRALAGSTLMTTILTTFPGHGLLQDPPTFETDVDRLLGYVPRVKVEILLEDAWSTVLERLRCESCSGQGVFGVTPVVESGAFCDLWSAVGGQPACRSTKKSQ